MLCYAFPFQYVRFHVLLCDLMLNYTTLRFC